MSFFKKNFGKKNNDEYYEEIPGRYDDEEYDDFDDYGDEDYDAYEDDRQYEQPARTARSSRRTSAQPAYAANEPSINARRGAAQGRQSNVVTMDEYSRPQNQYVNDRDMKMVIFKPSSYDETESVIDSLKARKPIVINLDEINPAVAQRILDFISGAVYALNGDIRRAARNIFVVAPSNIEISSTGLDDDSVNGEL
jgi:cell division inhibitor SepF